VIEESKFVKANREVEGIDWNPHYVEAD